MAHSPIDGVSDERYQAMLTLIDFGPQVMPDNLNVLHPAANLLQTIVGASSGEVSDERYQAMLTSIEWSQVDCFSKTSASIHRSLPDTRNDVPSVTKVIGNHDEVDSVALPSWSSPVSARIESASRYAAAVRLDSESS